MHRLLHLGVEILHAKAQAVETQALERARALPAVSEARPVLMSGSLYLLSEFFTLYPQGLAHGLTQRLT